MLLLCRSRFLLPVYCLFTLVNQKVLICMKNASRFFSKMEFAISKTDEKRRLGKLTLNKNDRELTLVTPACLLYTKSGCVPHLTHDTLRLAIFQDRGTPSSNGANRDDDNDEPAASSSSPDRLLLPLLFSIGAFLPHRKSLDFYQSSQSRNGIVDFVGVSRDFDVMSFVTQNDPAAPLPSGFNAGQSISLWNYTGRAEVTPARAVELTSSLAPDVAQILADVDVGYHQNEEGSSSKKRQMKAVNRSRAFSSHVESLMKEETDKENGKELTFKTSYWATAIVGLEEQHFKRYLQELSECPNAIQGYVLDGLQPAKNLRCVESSSHVKRATDAISHVIAALPSSKPRLLSHVATPQLVVEGVENGVDLFDTSFAVVAAERGGALVFDCELSTKENDDVHESDSSFSNSDRVIEIDINSAEFADDFTPLLPGCPCYACTTHTRAYVHHLLVTQELLAHVLLTIHNIFRYTHFFHRLRGAIKSGEWNRFKTLILSNRHDIVVVEKEKRAGDEENAAEEGKRRKKLVL